VVHRSALNNAQCLSTLARDHDKADNHNTGIELSNQHPSANQSQYPGKPSLKQHLKITALTLASTDTMCFYEQYRFECGDWKWGNFKRHCQAEYRMGETCGMKLVYLTVPLDQKCQLCQSIDKKSRRYEKTKADYSRWYQDPTRQASAAKALEDLNALAQEIKTIQADRQNRMQSVGNIRRAAPQQRYAAQA